jgi:hypothetical protein
VTPACAGLAMGVLALLWQIFDRDRIPKSVFL